jgi:hypothetical protein
MIKGAVAERQLADFLLQHDCLCLKSVSASYSLNIQRGLDPLHLVDNVVHCLKW